MAQIIGYARLGRDAEVRYTPDGKPITNLSLAFNYGRKGEDGNRPTQWVDGALWGPRAEALSPYLLKGIGIVVTLDDPHIETFQKADGTSGHKLTGTVSAIEFAGGPKQEGQGGQAPQQRTQGQAGQQASRAPQQRPAQSQAPQARGGAGSAPRSAGGGAGDGWDAMDSDIPF
ncbi:MAG: single-stranded DNA-binding protein [Burkholderiales bacterium]